ncbi:23S rRNA (pseudouridine(1915)-N(3))-methyltransferase RlmH [Sutterella sp.]|uniref:23S rRNA (pseudouridine(1915)-N(3))-methyltransferase RlmH n=1 Tax=Sutterella sp. TaxID=1981025 RepID=UPI0026DFBD9C|nr:23S rRNA (pseudouridine(1915)-N(3))-methyltransferase RlmH [Sutterella sp.]MDO5530634.1 23S rRNA (pseudouridine(1915)-N(3))-methyltransferase RlmH [Sutterella sp.]
MRIRILAVGQHISDWAQDAVRGYLARFPRTWRVELKEIRTEPRAGGMTPAKLMALEGERIQAEIAPGDFVIVLDEHGRDLTTTEFAKSLAGWMSEADRLVFVIGGPDGLSPEVKGLARATMRLSAMTLPHALARVLLTEQIYRAWSISAGHPYHRA